MYGDQTAQDILSYTNMRAVRLREPSEPLTWGEEEQCVNWVGMPWFNSHKSTTTWPVEYRRKPCLTLRPFFY